MAKEDGKIENFPKTLAKGFFIIKNAKLNKNAKPGFARLSLGEFFGTFGFFKVK